MKCPHCKTSLKTHEKICANCGHTIKTARKKRRCNLILTSLLLLRLLLTLGLVFKMFKQHQ
ncbi:hypothetical protein ACLUWI_09510, partial [Limosilactobacillus mucosae]|uniref:hypothetical protein n=1 Tax=Limosilactobacillus mucosae TaxID=97478 RepID=UPI003995D333